MEDELKVVLQTRGQHKTARRLPRLKPHNLGAQQMGIVRVRRGKRRAPVGGIRESIPIHIFRFIIKSEYPMLVNQKGREDASNFVGPVIETFSTLLIHLEGIEDGIQ